MKIQEVIDRALQDPQFAAALQAKALAGSRAGGRSAEFKDLLGEFASSPEELATFDRIMNAEEAVGTTTFTVTLTGLTITTAACTTTSTTSTTTLTTGHIVDDPKKTLPE